MAQKIRVKISTSKKSHLEVANDAVTVYEGLKDNPAFPPNPPVGLDVFKTAIDAYISSISVAGDGNQESDGRTQ